MAEYIMGHDGELYHYGVPGMKWGVRRDARLLANSRRNKKVREAHSDYKSGKITKDQRNKRINAAQNEKKKWLDDTEKQFAKAKSDSERARLGQDIAKKTLREVPHAEIKRGAASVNAIFGAFNVASTGLATASLAVANPAFAGAALTAAVVGTAAEAGYRYVIQLGLDKVS